jgi:hypothetical protein
MSAINIKLPEVEPSAAVLCHNLFEVVEIPVHCCPR